MRSIICVLVAVVCLAGAAAAQEIEPKRPPREVRQPLDLFKQDVWHVNEDGTIRHFATAAERDRVLAQEAKERQTRQENTARWQDIQRQQQERRAEVAGWKLAALGVGLLLGLLGAVFGRK
jgi:hypothetical protein